MLPGDSCRTNKLKDGAGGGRTATSFPSIPMEDLHTVGNKRVLGHKEQPGEAQPGPGTSTQQVIYLDPPDVQQSAALCDELSSCFQVFHFTTSLSM